MSQMLIKLSNSCESRHHCLFFVCKELLDFWLTIKVFGNIISHEHRSMIACASHSALKSILLCLRIRNRLEYGPLD